MKSAPKKYARNACASTLRSLREETGKRQEDVAIDLNLSRSTIVKMETGQQDIKPAHLMDFAQYYGTTSDYILGLTGARRAPETIPSCDKLGLSDDAVFKLEEYKDRGRFGRVISKIIEHDMFEDLVECSERAITSPDVIVDNKNDVSRLCISAKKAGYDLIPSGQASAFRIFSATLILQKIIYDIADGFFSSDFDNTGSEGEDDYGVD